MSDNPFLLPPVPMMTPERARDVGRGYEALAMHLTELGVERQAVSLRQQAQWWLTYSIALAQTQKPKESDT